MVFDLHVHSIISPCSTLSLEDILHHSQAKGLNGVCITDHNSMEARQWITEGMQSNGLCVIIGQEYSTPQGDFLLFGPYEDLVPGMSGMEVLSYVQKTGGAAVAAHPFREMRPLQEKIINSRMCHIIEQVNGRNTFEENRQTQIWLENYPLFSVKGSDAHSLEELGVVSFNFDFPILSRNDLIQALNYA